MTLAEAVSGLPHREAEGPDPAAPLLEVEDLHTEFATSRGTVRAVEGVSFNVRRGEVVAIVGESGSGKSVTALSIMRLLPRLTGRVPKGRVMFDGRNLLTLDDEQMREIRGRDISMIFQEPMTSLNPVLTIGFQIMEPLLIHLDMDPASARKRATTPRLWVMMISAMLSLRDRSFISSRICAWMVTSSAVVGSSAMISFGLQASPIAIITRWRMPPENWCGY